MDVKDNEFERLYAETFHGIEQGSVLKGKVVAVRADSVVVDVGYKSEGVIPSGEFMPSELSVLRVGDDVDVYVEAIKDFEGVLVLSKDRASKIKAWGSIERSLRDDLPVEGSIIGKTKGGLFVDISGVKAFLPGSHVDIRPVADTDSLIGVKMLFKVLKLGDRRSGIVVSRKALIEEERLEKKAKILETLRDGAVMKGTVKNITDYGVFVDLGGMDGLLHISDISWGRISHPSEFFAVGDETDVIVLKYDPVSGRVTLGYKQMRPDPWADVDERHPVGSKVRGRVVSLTDYGAFVEVEEGLEGLVHISEMDWAPRPKHPSKYISVGETVDVSVLKVDKADRRLSLSLRQLKPSPWSLVAQNYKPGQAITGKVRGITDFGAFVGLPEGVDGLIHISDISWTKHVKHPSEALKKGQKVDAVVLSVEPEKERLALGIKQLKPDPWLGEVQERFKVGDEFPCSVLRVTDFGIFVELESDVEGLIYASEATGEPPMEGEEVWARIIKLDGEQRKIGLSMKNLKRSAI